MQGTYVLVSLEIKLGRFHEIGPLSGIKEVLFRGKKVVFYSRYLVIRGLINGESGNVVFENN